MPLPTDGQGIALAISQQIVLRHRGTIQVESTKGEGTTFSILLPIT
jgi:signal transduction histidine kinase